MNLKKLISGASVATLALAGAVSASSFNDVAGHWVETGSFLNTAIEAGIIDGTKPSFNPEASITRAALTKMVAVYDNGGTFPTSVDYLNAAGFADVASDAWYYDVVNYAAEEGIVDGSKTTFAPARPVNRAEAVKVITLALEVPSVDVTLPYTDVASDAWFAPYVRNAYGNCIVKGGSNFNPADSITRAAAVKVFVASINPGCKTTSPTATPVVTGTTVPTATPVNATPTPVVTTDATVEVVVSQNSPAAQSIPKNAYQVPFIALDITASNDEDLLLSGLTVQHTGLGDADEVKNVQVFEGVIPRGSDKDFSGEDDIATLNLQGDPVVIEAGTTKTVYIRADIKSLTETAGEHAVFLASADSVVLVGKDTGAVVKTTGTFPIAGATMKVANITIGGITASLEKPSDSTVTVGEKEVEVARFKLEATSVEDVYVSILTLETTGTLDDGDVENFYIEIDGERVSNVVPKSVNDKITFVLTEKDAAGYKIFDGSKKTFVVKADFTGAIDSFQDDAFGLFIDESSDITVIGAKYGFGVAKTLTGVSESNITVDYKIDVEGGDITFVLDSTATDVAEDTDGIVFGTLTITNKAEPIEIDKNGYKFELITTSPTGADASDDLENIKLVSAKNGSTILGAVYASACGAENCTQLLDWNDDLYIGANETAVFYIVADTKDDLVENSTYKFKLSSSPTPTTTGGLDAIKVTGQVSDETKGFDIKPAGTLTTKNFTLQEAGVTVTNKALQSDTYVASTKGAEVWKGTIRADNVKDISIERLVFEQTGTATGSDLNAYTVQASIDGNWVNIESGLNVTSPFTFSDLDELTAGKFIVAKGEEVEIRVVADIADEVTSNNTVITKLTSVEFQEVETDGTYGDTTTVPFAYTASTFTLVDAGTLAVTLNGADTPSNENFIAGASKKTVAVYKVKAEDENVSINDVTVEVVAAADPAGLSGAAPVIAPTATIATEITTPASYATTSDKADITLSTTETGVGTIFKVIIPATADVAADGTVATTPVATEHTYEIVGGKSLAEMAAEFAAKITTESSRVKAYATNNVITIEQLHYDAEADADRVADGTLILELSTDAGVSFAAAIDSTAGNPVADGPTAIAQVTTFTTTGTLAAGETVVYTVNGTAYATLAAAVTGEANITASTLTTLTAIDPADASTLNAFTASAVINAAPATAGALPANDADAVKSVALYNGTTLIDKVTLNEDNKAVFEDIDFVVEAGKTEALTVKVNLNNIGTTSADTAKSGHVFTTSLVVDEAKGTESGDVLTLTQPTAPTAFFVVTNNKLQVSKSSQNTALSGTTADLLKFKLFDASTDGDNAEVTSLTFNLAATNVDLSIDATKYELVGGNAEWTCTAPAEDGTTGVSKGGDITCTTAGNEEISATGVTFVLKTTGLSGTIDNASVTTKLTINSTTPNDQTTPVGVTWTDGGNGSEAQANGASVSWIDFGEADEATSYILNTVSN